jgi:MFS family permease
MTQKQFTEKSRFKLTNASVSTFLLATAFVWYLCAFKFLQDAVRSESFGDNLLLIIAVNFLAFAFSAFLGTKLTQFIQKRKVILKFWMLIGIFVSFLFILLNFADYRSAVLLAGIIGAYFGLGMPTFMGYFTVNTESNNRGKFAGLAVFLTVFIFAIISSIVEISKTVLIASSALAVLLAVGLLCLYYLNPPEKKAESKNEISFRSVISNKTFILYIIPWLMLSLINDLTMQINADYFNNLNLSNHLLIENVLAGFSAVVCGFLADKQGRKRLALMGFTLLGIGYAALGLFNGDILAAWLYICVDGIAWGAFAALFLFTIWGDIAQQKNSEKYYILGVLPYLFSTFAGATLGTYMSQVVTENTVFSFAAFFLFAATLPLFYAPETLSEKLMKDRELKSYIEKAKKKVKKDSEKAGKKEKVSEPNPQEEPETTGDENYNEARKLAEKYY